jgi:hypothetical protein
MITLKSFGFRWWLVLVLLFACSATALADGPFQFFPVSPCRVVDTRKPDGMNAGPAVTAYQARGFRIQGLCGVPAGANAVALNVTVVTPGEAGWLGVYPATGFSGTSTINFETGEFAIANGAIVPVSAVAGATDTDVSVVWGNYSSSAPRTHVLLDVTGYFQ